MHRCRLALSLAAFAAGALSLGSAAAQPETPTDGAWRGTAGAAFSATSGNSSSTATALNADMRRATESDRITLGASATYARSRSEGVERTSADRWSGVGQYDFNLSSAVFAFGKLGLEADRLTGLQLRSTLGTGLGYKLLDSPAASFTVFGGVGHTRDRYRSPQTIDGVTASRFSRSSVLLGEESAHRLADNTRFKQRLEVYPGVSGDRAVLAKFTAGLETAVSRSLSLTTSLVADHNSKPPAGRKRNDVSLLAGLRVSFGAP
jgi:putative salt-induced outer membrane protein